MTANENELKVIRSELGKIRWILGYPVSELVIMRWVLVYLVAAVTAIFFKVFS